jgi:hypothetical protein
MSYYADTVAAVISDDPFIGFALLAALLITIAMAWRIWDASRTLARARSRERAELAALGRDLAERRRVIASQRFAERKAKHS